LSRGCPSLVCRAALRACARPKSPYLLGMEQEIAMFCIRWASNSSSSVGATTSASRCGPMRKARHLTRKRHLTRHLTSSVRPSRRNRPAYPATPDGEQRTAIATTWACASTSAVGARRCGHPERCAVLIWRCSGCGSWPGSTEVGSKPPRASAVGSIQPWSRRTVCEINRIRSDFLRSVMEVVSIT